MTLLDPTVIKNSTVLWYKMLILILYSSMLKICSSVPTVHFGLCWSWIMFSNFKREVKLWSFTLPEGAVLISYTQPWNCKSLPYLRSSLSVSCVYSFSVLLNIHCRNLVPQPNKKCMLHPDYTALCYTGLRCDLSCTGLRGHSGTSNAYNLHFILTPESYFYNGGSAGCEVSLNSGVGTFQGMFRYACVKKSVVNAG